MQSIWNYLRSRTRDSMLAGMQDALEHAERGDRIVDEEEAEISPARLVGKSTDNSLSPPPAVDASVMETEISTDTRADSEFSEQRPETKLDASTAGADRLRETMRNETQPLDPFEERLMQTNPQLNAAHRSTPPRKRGRPRKNPEK